MAEGGYTIEAIESAPFGEMSYLVWIAGESAGIVVDPGFDTETILEQLTQHGLRLAAILNTHGHADHIAGNAAMKREYPEAPLIIGRNEAALLTDPEANLSAGFGLPLSSPEADPIVNGARRVAFISADDNGADKEVENLLAGFGCSVIDLGNLRDGGLIQQAGGPLAGRNFLEEGDRHL